MARRATAVALPLASLEFLAQSSVEELSFLKLSFLKGSIVAQMSRGPACCLRSF